MNRRFYRLKGALVSVGATQEDIAEHLGMSVVSMSKRMNGKIEFRKDEIDKIIKFLEDRGARVKYEELFKEVEAGWKKKD